MIITIDGPAGSGKSTISKILSKRLGFMYINSGAIYRAITYFILSSFKNIDENNIDKNIENLILNKNTFNFQYLWKNENLTIFVNKENITESLKKENISKWVSFVAKNKKVRDFVLQIEKDLSKNSNVILEGRDSGTVVFPFAEKKFFLVASLEERVSRRLLELIKLGEIKKDCDFNVEKERIKSLINSRDINDQNRKISPLKKAIDAIEVDTTGKSINEVVNILENFVRNKNE